MNFNDTTREAVLAAIGREKLIVIVRGVPADRLIPLTEAMYAGGVRLLEVPYSADGRVSDEETADGIRTLAAHFAGRMEIGAGTVLTERQVELTAAAGGRFIISPNTNETVIAKTRALGLVSLPGAFSPTEIEAAHEAGADFVKLFPAAALGAAYIKAVRAPLSDIKLLVVGGIDDRNAAEYLAAGAVGIGVGSGIVDRALLEAGDYAGITRLAKAYVAAVGGKV